MPSRRAAPWVPVILSGGAGARLWPLSRQSNPKPFITLNGGATLLRRTVARAAALNDLAGIVTVTNRDLLVRTATELSGDGAAIRYITEPAGRNTAPAVAVAALEASLVWGDAAVLFVMPADHWIKNVSAFVADAQAAAKLASRGRLVTFGIAPTRAETGFGWLELGDAVDGTAGFEVRRFVEKPPADVAREFAADGGHLWNAGLFCFTAGAILAAFERQEPALLDAARESWMAAGRREVQGALVADLDDAFAQVPAASLDHAIMEKAEGVAAIRARFDWTDIGSWLAVHEALPHDREGNAVSGDAVLIDVKGSLVHSESRMVAAVGLEDLVVVDTPDALLVAHRSRSQDVREVVERLRGLGHESADNPREVTRPWGTYTVLDQGEGLKIKRIVVRPGLALSMQRHARRSEHWVVVSGEALVVRDGGQERLGPNESTFVPVGQKHRLVNPGETDLVIIEVQCGSYVGEDDIERFDDRWGRT